jgi:hypothetical protein
MTPADRHVKRLLDDPEFVAELAARRLDPDPLHVPETVVPPPSGKRLGLALALLSALAMLALAAGVWWWLR